jgi:hypothetical protein
VVTRGTTAAFAIFTALCALSAESATAKPAIPHHHQVSALYVIDHRGRNPASDADLLAYSREFHTILRSCKINVDDLTNSMLWLSFKASEQGDWYVSSLMMMKAVTRRITWTTPTSCRGTFDLAEGHMEAGGP